MIRAALLTTALILIPSPMSSQEAHGFRIEEGQRVTPVKAKRYVIYRQRIKRVRHRQLGKPELPRSPVQSAEQPATGAALPAQVPVAENFNDTWIARFPDEPMPVMEAWTIVEHPVAFKDTQHGKVIILVAAASILGAGFFASDICKIIKGVKHVG